MSGTILVLAAAAAILFTAGIRLGWFVLGGGLMGVVMAVIVFVGGYNSDRIKTWLDPWWDPSDKGYQIVQSLYSLADGGLAGTGIGKGLPTYIPVVESDFIFSAIGEEMGLLGSSAVLVLFLLLCVRGFATAARAKSDSSAFAAVGLTSALGF